MRKYITRKQRGHRQKQRRMPDLDSCNTVVAWYVPARCLVRASKTFLTVGYSQQHKCFYMKGFIHCKVGLLFLQHRMLKFIIHLVTFLDRLSHCLARCTIFANVMDPLVVAD